MHVCVYCPFRKNLETSDQLGRPSDTSANCNSSNSSRPRHQSDCSRLQHLLSLAQMVTDPQKQNFQ